MGIPEKKSETCRRRIPGNRRVGPGDDLAVLANTLNHEHTCGCHAHGVASSEVDPEEARVVVLVALVMVKCLLSVYNETHVVKAR